jgi:hypothetical protein
MSIIEVRCGESRQPHKTLVAQGELTKLAIYNQSHTRDK